MLVHETAHERHNTMYRKPRSPGNPYAYATADTLEDIAEGRKRCRKPDTILVDMTAAGHLECNVCGLRLDADYTAGNDTRPTNDDRARVKHDPKTGELTATHYYCSWMRTLEAAVNLGRKYQLAEAAALANTVA